MKPLSVSAAPGPNWVSVIASLFQKMLLNNATGFEKCGAPAGSIAWNAGSFASLVRPAPCGTPTCEDSDEPVVTLLAIVLLMMRMLDESSSMMAPPRSAARLFTIMLLRMLIG